MTADIFSVQFLQLCGDIFRCQTSQQFGRLFSSQQRFILSAAVDHVGIHHPGNEGNQRCRRCVIESTSLLQPVLQRGKAYSKYCRKSLCGFPTNTEDPMMAVSPKTGCLRLFPVKIPQ